MDERLAALDWNEYSCQWWKCADTAVNEIHTHVVNNCNNRNLCDVFGNAILLLCQHHTDELKLTATHRISRLRKGRPECRSCGAPLAHVSDVVREETALITKGTTDDRQRGRRPGVVQKADTASS